MVDFSKYRFIQEADWRPMVGVFPIVDLPTGNINDWASGGEERREIRSSGVVGR